MNVHYDLLGCFRSQKFKNRNQWPFIMHILVLRRNASDQQQPSLRCGVAKMLVPSCHYPAAAAGCNHHRQDDECRGWWRLAGPGRLWWDFNVSQFTPGPTTYTYLHLCLHLHHACTVPQHNFLIRTTLSLQSKTLSIRGANIRYL